MAIEKGVPVSLKPFTVGIAANNDFVVYPSDKPGLFVLEEFESGDTAYLDSKGQGDPLKFVFGRHSVALQTTKAVLFWNLDSKKTASPLESWHAPVDDIYYSYGYWYLIGPNVTFDPVIQESKKAEIDPPPELVFKGKQVWAGKYLHVGEQAFDLGDISCIATTNHYIIATCGRTIKVLFDLKEVGTIEFSEDILAVAAGFPDDSLEVYVLTHAKVSQISVSIDDFEDVNKANSSETDSKSNYLISGRFCPELLGSTSAGAGGHETNDGADSSATSSTSSTTNESASNSLLSLLHGKSAPMPPRPPSTTSLPAISREGFSTPVSFPDDKLSHEDLMSLVHHNNHQSAPANKAKTPRTPKRKADEPPPEGYVPRCEFDKVVADLKLQIIALQQKISELQGGAPAGYEVSSNRTALSNLASSHTPGGDTNKPSKEKSQPLEEPVKDGGNDSAPASVADAVIRTTQGQRGLQKYFESHLEELETYLAGAPTKSGQLMRLVLIDAYHNTKLSKALVEKFGPPVIDPEYYNRIVGEENIQSS